MSSVLIPETAVLHQRIADLEYRIAEMSEVPSDKLLLVKRRLGITPSQAKIVVLLDDGHVRSTAWLAYRVCRDLSDRESIKVQVAKIRKAIAPIILTTYPRIGYCFEGEHLAAIAAITAGREVRHG